MIGSDRDIEAVPMPDAPGEWGFADSKLMEKMNLAGWTDCDPIQNGVSRKMFDLYCTEEMNEQAAWAEPFPAPTYTDEEWMQWSAMEAAMRVQLAKQQMWHLCAKDRGAQYHLKKAEETAKPGLKSGKAKAKQAAEKPGQEDINEVDARGSAAKATRSGRGMASEGRAEAAARGSAA